MPNKQMNENLNISQDFVVRQREGNKTFYDYFTLYFSILLILHYIIITISKCLPLTSTAWHFACIILLIPRKNLSCKNIIFISEMSK